MIATPHRMRRIIPVILGLGIAFVFFADPVAAHAAWFDIGGMAFGAILDGILAILVALNSLLGSLLSATGSLLNWVLSWQTTELTVVAVAWTIIRDMCNLAFIVVFIGISFGTIFNATGWVPSGWHYRQALSSLIIAALMMNFSLAIGKVVVLVSNEAMKVVLTIVKDPGQMLVAQLQPVSLAIGGIDEVNTSAALNAPLAGIKATLTKAEDERYQKCITEEKIVDDADPGFLFTKSLARYFAKVYSFGAYTSATKIRKSAGDCYLAISDARYGTTPGQVAIAAQKRIDPELPKGTNQQKVMFIGDAIFKAFMILIFISCLGSAASFLAFRVLITWILLATSALAWMTYGIPGQRSKFWGPWWNHMIAWNVFGPLYLLTLIPGLVMLGGSSEMLLRLQNAGANIGVSNALFQQLMYYVFAAMVFVGGLGLSLKSSFAGTVKGTQIVGDWANKMGVFQTPEAKFGQLAKYSGATARFEGAKAGVSELYKKKVTAPLARRDEDIRALYQARFGDRSAQEALQMKRISERSKKNKDDGVTLSDLRKQFENEKKNSPEYFAAARALVEAGELNENEMSSYVKNAAAYSPALGQSAREAVQKQLKSTAKDRKYKTTDEVVKSMDELDLKGRDRDAFLSNIKSNQPLMYAKLAGAGLIIKDGKKLTTTEVLESSAGKLSDEEWVQAFEEKMPLGDKAQYTFNAKLQSKDAYKILAAAGKETRTKLEAEIIRLGGGQAKPAPTGGQSVPSEMERNQAAQSAVNMAGGITPERREEIRRDMETLNNK